MLAPAPVHALAAFSGVVAALTGYSQLPPSGLLLLAAAALTCVLAGLFARAACPARAVNVIPLRGRAVALLTKSRRTAFLRQRDPDADGRARPRAPAASPAA